MPDLDRAAPVAAILAFAALLLVLIAAIKGDSDRERRAMRAYCEAKFSAASTAADTVVVLAGPSRYHCEFALIPEDR